MKRNMSYTRAQLKFQQIFRRSVTDAFIEGDCVSMRATLTEVSTWKSSLKWTQNSTPLAQERNAFDIIPTTSFAAEMWEVSDRSR